LDIIIYTIIFVALYISFYVVYISLLFIVHMLCKDEDLLEVSLNTSFGIIIPAHNEEIMLPRLLESISKLVYPNEKFKVYVVADNCNDSTADIAMKYNVNVISRVHFNKIGKGYAIKYAIDNMKNNGHDAFLIIDADSIISPDSLIYLNYTIMNGGKVIQCSNGVANPNESWFTRLLDVSRTIGNKIIEPAKDLVGLNAHLQGNGMCFHKEIIDRYGWDAYSRGEDWEYYAKMVKMGERIRFQKNANIYHQESENLWQATPQRMRWSGGKFSIIIKYGFGLFIEGILTLDLKKIDASFPLILPNPSLAVNISISTLFLALLMPNFEYKNYILSWIIFLIFVQLNFFFIGVYYTKNRVQKLMSLFIAPIFLLWKMGIDILSILGIGTKKWIRTKRKNIN